VTTDPYPTSSVAEQAASRVKSAYAGDEERPLGSFLALMAVYGAATGALGVAVKRRGLPDGLPLADLLLLGVATAKLSRLISRDRVTSPLRAPVTEFEDFANASEVEEAPRGTGLRLALGELVTCPYCLAQWVGTGLLGGLLLKPRETRLVAGLFALLAVNDAVQVGHEHLMKQTS
jgi:hypothetical protein